MRPAPWWPPALALLLLAASMRSLPASSAPQVPPPPLAAPVPGSDSAPPGARWGGSNLRSCVTLHGNLGCAARLYAELLCRVVGAPPALQTLEPQLARQYALAAIDFTGLSAEAVESAAVSEQVPQICPDRSPEIQALFAPLMSPRPAAD